MRLSAVRSLIHGRLDRLVAGDASTFDVAFVYYQREPAYSLGLASISAYLKKADPDVRAHLIPIYREDTPQKIVDLVRAVRPKLIGMAAMSPTWLPSKPYLSALRRGLPDTPILVGGYQGIVSPEETIGHHAVDYVCIGDGEEPTASLVRALRGRGETDRSIVGLWEKKASGEVIRRPPWLVRDLAEMPFPDYSIFEREGSIAYLSPRGIQSQELLTVPVVSGRGCPYRCSYCANTTLLDKYGGKGAVLRKFEPEGVVDELVRIRDRYGAQFFQFWDEEFLYDHRYARRLLEDYRRRVGLPFSAFARVENMEADVCRLVAECGGHSLWFGIESGSEAYRRRYLGRRMSNHSILDAASTASRHGIKRFAFNMVGMPFESPRDAEETLQLARTIRPELTVFSQYLPLPGTPLYEVCRANDLLLEPSPQRQMWPLGTLNIREHEGSITAPEMKRIAAEIMSYLEEHNRFDA